MSPGSVKEAEARIVRELQTRGEGLRWGELVQAGGLAERATRELVRDLEARLVVRNNGRGTSARRWFLVPHDAEAQRRLAEPAAPAAADDDPLPGWPAPLHAQLAELHELDPNRATDEDLVELTREALADVRELEGEVEDLCDDLDHARRDLALFDELLARFGVPPGPSRSWRAGWLEGAISTVNDLVPDEALVRLARVAPSAAAAPAATSADEVA